MIGIFLFLLFVAAVYYLFVRKKGKSLGSDMAELARDGVGIDARITSKYFADSNHRYFRYTFETSSQQSVSNQITPSLEQWKRLEEGDRIPIVYLVERPEINATLDMVEKMRAALSTAIN